MAGDIATNLLNVVMIAFYAIVMLQYDVVLTLITIAMAVVTSSRSAPSRGGAPTAIAGC